ncbi:MAG: glycosyltransferase family 4 protein [Patescibacteria group bacterium]
MMKNKKIAQIICTFPPYKGGIGNSALQFSELLQKRGAAIVNFTPNYRTRKAEVKTMNVNGIKVKAHFLPPFLKYGNAALLPSLIRLTPKYDIVYLHYPFFGGAEIVWMAKKIFRKKFKLAIHYHMDVKGLSLSAKIFQIPSFLIFNSLFKKAEIITCANIDYIKHSRLKKIYQKNPEKFLEIPFGVDTNKFFPRKKKTNNKITILFVGGLDKAHYFKGVEYLIEAARILKEETTGISWEIHIVGEGELKKYYQNKAKEAGLKDHVHFKGGVDQERLTQEYQESDIFVLPSINKGEAFGMVLLEAMACGTPVIASDLPGVRSVFKNGEQGYTVAPKNARELTEKIKLLINDPEKRRLMGSNALKLVEEKYKPERTGEKLGKMIKKIEQL